MTIVLYCRWLKWSVRLFNLALIVLYNLILIVSDLFYINFSQQLLRCWVLALFWYMMLQEKLCEEWYWYVLLYNNCTIDSNFWLFVLFQVWNQIFCLLINFLTFFINSLAFSKTSNQKPIFFLFCKIFDFPLHLWLSVNF